MARTYVLIPGAWHTASSWAPVAKHLRSAGQRAEVVELPGQRVVDNDSPRDVRLQDAIDAVVGHFGERDLHGVVLVAHSLGGYIANGALPSIAGRVAHVVYYSALIPTPGVSLSSAFPEPMAPLRAAAEQSEDGAVPVPDDSWLMEAFVPGASPDLRQLVGGLLVPCPGAYFLDSIERPLTPRECDIACDYLLGEGDLLLPPPAEQFPAMVHADPIYVQGGHEAVFTAPGPLANQLLASGGR